MLISKSHEKHLHYYIVKYDDDRKYEKVTYDALKYI